MWKLAQSWAQIWVRYLPAKQVTTSLRLFPFLYKGILISVAQMASFFSFSFFYLISVPHLLLRNNHHPECRLCFPATLRVFDYCPMIHMLTWHRSLLGLFFFFFKTVRCIFFDLTALTFFPLAEWNANIMTGAKAVILDHEET